MYFISFQTKTVTIVVNCGFSELSRDADGRALDLFQLCDWDHSSANRRLWLAVVMCHESADVRTVKSALVLVTWKHSRPRGLKTRTVHWYTSDLATCIHFCEANSSKMRIRISAFVHLVLSPPFKEYAGKNSTQTLFMRLETLLVPTFHAFTHLEQFFFPWVY